MRILSAATIGAAALVLGLLSGSPDSDAPALETSPATPAIEARVSGTRDEAQTPGAPAAEAATLPERPAGEPAVPSAIIAPTRMIELAAGIAGSLSADRLVYAAARGVRDRGDFLAAAEGFDFVARRGGTLAPVAKMRMAQALAQADRPRDAALAFDAALEDPALPSALRVVTLDEAAGVHDELGDPDSAVELLARIDEEPAASSFDRARARWRIAEIRRDWSNASWTDDARAVLSIAPSSTVARQALDALDDADAFVEPLVAAYVRYRGRENDAARALYLDVVAAGGDNAGRATAWFYLGALAERSGDLQDALDAYANSVALAPYGALADDARYWRGRVLEETGEPVAAALEYDDLVAAFPQSDFAADAELRAAVALGLDGRATEALRRLEEVVQRRPGRTASTAARWHGVIRKMNGASPALVLDPSSYHPAALASLIDDRATAPLPSSAFEEWPLPPADDPSAEQWMTARFGPPAEAAGEIALRSPLPLARELASVGERPVARALLRGAVRSASEPHELFVLARESRALGLHDVALVAGLGILRPLTASEMMEAPKSVLGLAYPAPFTREIADALEYGRVPPLLLLALVRQESAFDPQAGSHAGALGLTQVIAPTGEQIAEALGESWDVARLFDPGTSLRYGAYYLATQLEQFDGNVLAALAAYNAGPGSAGRWLRGQAFDGPDGYLHAVDYAETRMYLEHVLENYAWYRFIYAAAESPSLR